MCSTNGLQVQKMRSRPVQLLKAQTTVVLLLYFLNCILEKVPDVFNIPLIHGHLYTRNMHVSANQTHQQKKNLHQEPNKMTGKLFSHVSGTVERFPGF